MNPITRALASLAAAIMIMAGLSAGTTAEAAKDITWGRHAASSPVAQPQEKDITWGKHKAWFTDVTHAGDDSGWSDPIHVVCSNGEHRYLARGESTVFSNKACTGQGAAKIIVPANHTVYCKNALPPYQNTYFYVGTNSLGSAQSWKCYDQKAL